MSNSFYSPFFPKKHTMRIRLKHILLFLLLLSFPFHLLAETDSDTVVKKKIGQMLIVGFRGTTADNDSYIIKAIKELNLGGVILFDKDMPGAASRNIEAPEQVKKLCEALQKASSTPLFIAVDAEGGMVNRLKPSYGFIDVPSHEELGEKNNPQTTYILIQKLARQLHQLGINTNFAPSVDLRTNPNNPIIAKIKRSFSANENIVTAQATAFIQAHRENNILTAIKHFPGHGSSSTDTHKGLADVTASYTSVELVPFEDLIKKDIVDMVMTSHIMNTNFDKKYPVTLSGYYIKNILRKKMHYNGVVVSDDMQMRALTNYFTLKTSLIKAIQAGCDMLILSNNIDEYDEQLPYKAVEILFQAVKQKKISYARIKDSIERINKLQNKIGKPAR